MFISDLNLSIYSDHHTLHEVADLIQRWKKGFHVKGISLDPDWT